MVEEKKVKTKGSRVRMRERKAEAKARRLGSRGSGGDVCRPPALGTSAGIIYRTLRVR